MGHIKEPKGVDLVVGPSTLTEQDKKMISEIIAHYKRTGKMPGKLQHAGHHKGKLARSLRKRVVA